MNLVGVPKRGTRTLCVGTYYLPTPTSLPRHVSTYVEVPTYLPIYASSACLACNRCLMRTLISAYTSTLSHSATTNFFFLALWASFFERTEHVCTIISLFSSECQLRMMASIKHSIPFIITNRKQ